LHDSDSFISEVSEAVRRDRLASTLRRYGWLIAALIVLIVGGAAVNEWLKIRSARLAAASGDALRAALAETDTATRDGMLDDIAAAGGPSAVLARFAAAGSRAQAGDRDGAAAALAAIADDGAVPELYRSLAALQKVMMLGEAMPASERAATLEVLTADGAPFRPLALEQRALMHLDAGDKPAAITDLEAVLADTGATEALRARARQLIVASGGALPAPGAPAPADG
jgi:hypothetical protein